MSETNLSDLPDALAAKLSPTAAANLARFLREPQYADDRQKARALVEAGDAEAIDALFWQVIPFGTGGRRGPMGEFGPATINDRTIAESAQGLAVYAAKANGRAGDAVKGRAVVAHDTRNNSRRFAEITARTLAGNGFEVFLFDSYRSTPALSFAVRHLGCDVGVMITASHNPPADNGFKAYWSTGGQVLAPHDKGIIEAVMAVQELNQTEQDDPKIRAIGPDVDEAFWKAVVDLSLSDRRDIPALFSPLHGVGETVCYEIVKRAGFTPDIYEPHRTPDGNFPNVDAHFPNPERTEVFEPLIEHARGSGAEVIFASDPDADRLGVVAKTSDGEFVRLSGNQVGALLTDYVCRRRSGELTGEHFVVYTLVTTPLIGAIARSHGLKVIDQLLVGFKYIGEAMDEHGPDRFVFGAEESLGYLAGEYARDKDAGIAALYLLEAAAELRAEGKTLLDRLDELFVRHGYFWEGQTSKVCPGASGAEQIARICTAFREQPPADLAGITMTSVRDFGRHEVRELPANTKTADLPQPQGNVLMFEGQKGDLNVRIAVRPSGTEPKIKFYLFAQHAVSDAAALADVKRETAGQINALQGALNAWLDGVLA